MWQMVTKQGSLKQLISEQHVSMVRRIAKLFDPTNQGKAKFRKVGRKALQVLYSYLEMNYSGGAAFPPFHAKFFADKYLPTEGDCLVVDPCAGWGGRFLGTLCVKRTDKVTYVGIDPETRNEEAYETIQGYYYKYLKQELKAERASKFFYRPFERWIKTKSAMSLHAKADLVITSPPYFDAEIYNADNSKQSAKSFKTYAEWREGFYTPLVQGAFDLLKPGGIFVLNIANTQSAKDLEKDARSLAKSIGFINFEYFKLAMRPTPGVKAGSKHQVLVDGTLYKFEPCFVFKKPLEPVKDSRKDERKKTAVTKVMPVASSKLPLKLQTLSGDTGKQLASKSEVGKDADYYLKLIRGWKDPNPKPVIEDWEGFQVVRDDLLAHGSKERFIDFMLKNANETEFVLGASNKVGWGAISLSAVCRKYGKKAVFFMAKTANPTWHQQEVLRLGGRIEWVANGMLNVTQARAREYAQLDLSKRRLLPIGLEDDTVLASVIKVARGLKIAPTEVWTVASSGTLSRGLQLAFPEAKFFAVQTGHTLTKASAGRAEVLISPYKFDKPVSDAHAPPYPSERYYDAKLWQFAREKGVKGALIWNVAG
jgi:tRNA1(Val) A37 N6-methylase TrmN6